MLSRSTRWKLVLAAGLLLFGLAACTTAGRKPAVTTLAELQGRPVGVLTGTMLDQMLAESIPGAQPVYFNTYPDQILALQSGKLDALILDTPIAVMYAANNAGIRLLPDKLRSDTYALAARLEDDALASAASALIRDLRADGTLQDMSARWLEGRPDERRMPDLPLEGGQGVLRFGTNSATEPFAYIDASGQVTGYDIELARRIAQRLGMQLEVVDMEFGAMIPALQTGKVDLIGACITVTAERAAKVAFTESYYDGGISALVRSPGSAVDSTGILSTLAVTFRQTFLEQGRYLLVWQGFLTTLQIALLSALFGTTLGFGLCLLRMARRGWIARPTGLLIHLVQGLPMVVLLMILYYLVFRRIDLPPLWVAVIGFSLNFGAYFAEMLRAGIGAVDPGQLEAASALGFGRLQVFLRITLPQAARTVLPVYRGEFISMLKTTSVVGYIAVQDLTKMGDIIRSRTYEAFLPLLLTAAIYFLIAWAFTSLLTTLEGSLAPRRELQSEAEAA